MRRLPSCNSRRRLIGASAAAALVLLMVVSPAPAQQNSSAKPAAIEGTVRESAGAPAAGASVLLECPGTAPLQATTNAEGRFSFQALPLRACTLRAVTAEKQSRPVSLNPDSAGSVLQVNLTLDQAAPSSPGSMDFADQPNFTVAAVTDWTAAGGHGSDAVLRTSEALNREALTLKPESGEGAPSHAPEKMTETESALRAAVAGAPQSFEANHKLGEFYLHAGRFRDAIPPLQAAYAIDPTDVDNAYGLAEALNGNGDFSAARDLVQKLIARDDNANLHRLLGELHEKLNDPLAAVHEFERAVRLDPSEQNYFEWGSELLLHRAIWQAKDVFSAGVKAYPQSQRMLTALGAALFAGALYVEAAQRLCEASDLNPADPEPYLFMGKIEISSPNPLPCVEQKLARFLQLRPADPLANYYYAMTLWKQKGSSADAPSLQRVQDLLTKAVTEDPGCSEAYLQLGVLEATRRDFNKAIASYNKAIEANPQMSEAHYRLGVAYDRVGDKEKAQQQFQLHDQIEKRQAAAVDKQRREVKQFLVVVDGNSADTAPR
jgi:tetratricopeptide (TPR) repeat protein